MAQQTETEIEMTHKDGKKRKRLTRTRLYQNGKRINLKMLAARKTLVAKR